MKRGKRVNVLGSVGVAFLIFATTSYAESVTQDMALRVAVIHIEATRNEWSALVHLGGERVRTGQIFELLDDQSQKLLGYIVELKPEGFIVISGNTSLDPVIAYSYHGIFSLQEHYRDEFLEIVRKDLAFRSDLVFSSDFTSRNRALNSMKTTQINAEKWFEYLSGQITFQATKFWPTQGSTSTGGWLETTWEQEAPYNNYCPKEPGSGKRCYVGCVAMAMAQVINYNSARRDYFHNVIFGAGDSYESDQTSPSIWIDADASVYNFPDFETLTGYLITLRTKYIADQNLNNNDIAALCFASGIPVKMQYSGSGSGTLTLWASGALKSKFGYTSSRYIKGDDEDFFDELSQNMKDSLPAILSMYNQEGEGHAVVCDGLQIRDNGDCAYHLNFGWGSDYPSNIRFAWYIIPDGIPMGFNIIDGAVVDIVAPQASYQPDNAISLSPDSDFIGDDIYNSTAEDQTLVYEAGYDNTVTYYIKIQNDGNIAGEYTAFAQDGAPAGWDVHLFEDEGNKEITTSITSVSGWSTGELEPEEEKVLRLEVTTPSTLTVHKTYSIEIKSVSDSSDDFEDVVSVVTSVGVAENAVSVPNQIYIDHIRRPLTGELIVRYGLPVTAYVKLAVYDAGGRLIKTLKDEKMPQGTHQIRWDCQDNMGEKVAAGSYFLVLAAAGQTARCKALILH
ncbi:C10 family peptidase [candidate division WOR-3 bacterium]|nr:C10 family peptidase [candidate division WOR-3 bacterium]